MSPPSRRDACSCRRRSCRHRCRRLPLRQQGEWGSALRSGFSLWTVGGAAATTALAVVLLWGLRRRPVTVQVTIASLAPVVAVAAGVAGGSWAMFISGHDLRTLVVILVGAGTVGMITALLFGSRISRSSAGLGELARRIGEEATLDGASADMRRAALDRGRRGSRRAREARPRARRQRCRASQRAALRRPRWSRAGASWSHGCRTTCAHRSRGSARWSRRSKTAWSTTPRRSTAITGPSASRSTGSPRSWPTCSSSRKIHAGALHLAARSGRARRGPLRRRRRRDAPGSREGGRAHRLARRFPGRQARSPRDGKGGAEPHRQRDQAHPAGRDDPGGGVRRPGDRNGLRVGGRQLRRDTRATTSSRVFELAYSGDVARTPGDGRAGLGLAVTRGLVEAQLGQGERLNEDGGCRFTIRLPLADLRPGAPRARH